MKTVVIRKSLGLVSMLSGTSWIISCLFPFLSDFPDAESSVFFYFFLFSVIPLMSLPGIFAVFYGFRLFRQQSIVALRCVCGAHSTYGVVGISYMLSIIMVGDSSEHITGDIFLLMGTFITIPIYLIALARISPLMGFEPLPYKSHIGKGLISIIALQVWLLLSEIFDEYAPIKDGYTHVHEEPWGILGFLVPSAVAYILYKLGIAKFVNNAEQVVTTNPTLAESSDEPFTKS